MSKRSRLGRAPKINVNTPFALTGVGAALLKAGEDPEKFPLCAKALDMDVNTPKEKAKGLLDGAMEELKKAGLA